MLVFVIIKRPRLRGSRFEYGAEEAVVKGRAPYKVDFDETARSTINHRRMKDAGRLFQ